jgi:transposase-like protein
MGHKKYSVETIIHKLREAEVELSSGTPIRQMVRKLGINTHTYYRWRREYGGLRVDQASRLKELERENGRLKTLVADQALHIVILKEAASGN